MTLAQVRAAFMSLLNRDDCSTAQADDFLRLGLARLQREVRIPTFERVHYVDVVSEPLDLLTLPADFLEAIDLFVDGVPLVRSTYRLLTRQSVYGTPKAYARFRNDLYLRGAAQVGTRVELLYYGEATALVNESDENEVTTSCPDLLIYSALGYAGDFFRVDERKDFETRYQAILATLNDQARADDFGGLQSIQPMYTDPGY